MSTSPAETVVVIDDDPDSLAFLAEAIRRDGFTVTTFSKPKEGVYHVIDHPASAVVVDLCMPEMDGIETVRRLQVSAPSTPIVGITGLATPQAGVYLQALRDAGAAVCLRKPIKSRELCDALRAAIKSRPA